MSYLDAVYVGDGIQLTSRKNPNNQADIPGAWALLRGGAPEYK
jgi:hypothetical protein